MRKSLLGLSLALLLAGCGRVDAPHGQAIDFSAADCAPRVVFHKDHPRQVDAGGYWRRSPDLAVFSSQDEDILRGALVCTVKLERPAKSATLYLKGGEVTVTGATPGDYSGIGMGALVFADPAKADVAYSDNRGGQIASLTRQTSEFSLKPKASATQTFAYRPSVTTFEFDKATDRLVVVFWVEEPWSTARAVAKFDSVQVATGRAN